MESEIARVVHTTFPSITPVSACTLEHPLGLELCFDRRCPIYSAVLRRHNTDYQSVWKSVQSQIVTGQVRRSITITFLMDYHFRCGEIDPGDSLPFPAIAHFRVRLCEALDSAYLIVRVKLCETRVRIE